MIVHNLGFHVESGNPSDYRATKYNSSIRQEKDFIGNIILFAKNKKQYRKRFFKNTCCQDNMVIWSAVNDSIRICKECGWIDEIKSEVIHVNEEKKSLLTEGDRILFCVDEKEPMRSDIQDIEKEFNL